MKKNRLLISVTTTKIYEFPTNAETADIAFDSFLNQTGKRCKLQETYKKTEIEDFIINKLNENKRRKT